MSRKSKLFLLFAAAGMFVLAAALYFSRDTIRGILRQKQEEAVAEEYLKLFSVDAKEYGPKETEESLISQEETKESLRTENYEASETKPQLSTAAEEASGASPAEVMTEPAFREIVDDRYYERGGVVYTPDYAQGELDCVLEIPCISLKRGVYKGNAAQIDHDLSIWLTTAAKEDMELGKTNYAIYGHNHTVQDLSFNRLKDVSVGDVFTLTKEDRAYVYRVSRIFAEWRSVGRKRYAMTTSLDPSLCYIFTCGRDYWPLNGVSTRYKDYIVEGTLEGICDRATLKNREIGPLNTSEEGPEPKEEATVAVAEPEETTKEPKEMKTAEPESTRDTEPLILPVLSVTEVPGSSGGAVVRIILTTPDGKPLSGSTLALLNDEGNEITSWIQEEDAKQLTLSEGTYVIAVTDLNRDLYEEPAGKELIVTAQTLRITTIGEETKERAVSVSQFLLGCAALSGALSLLFLFLFLISLVSGKKHR